MTPVTNLDVAATLSYCLTMIVTLSSKGQIVIPSSIRSRLGLHTRDQMVAEATDEAIILRPKRKPAPKVRVINSRKTGLPQVVTTASSRITSKMVHDALADFP